MSSEKKFLYHEKLESKPFSADDFDKAYLDGYMTIQDYRKMLNKDGYRDPKPVNPKPVKKKTKK